MSNLLKNKIQSIDAYNQKMSASMMEKTFFFEHLKEDVDIIVDFGCANAAMLEKIRSAKFAVEYVGFDINPEMVKLGSVAAAAKKLERYTLTSDWKTVEEKIKGKRAALLLSSVIHEVYSYSDVEDVDIFWKRVLQSNFSKIFIRDMMCSREIPTTTPKQHVDAVRVNFSPFLVRQWESHWGPLSNFKSMLHFLLTYHYVDNWTREYLENYFPISTEQFLEKIEMSEYSISQFNPHKLPFLEKKIQADFGIPLMANTHIVAVLTNG